MARLQTWETFPLTYRAQEVRQLAHWIAVGESCAVVGLPGCGRSNFLSFLCHRPEALAPYFSPNVGPLVLVPVDLNDLPAQDLATLYRVILRSFYRFRDHFKPSLSEAIARLYLEHRAMPDAFLSQSALQELLLAFHGEATRVVLVLNRFDRFCQEATPRMLNTLRSLRDSSRETFSFMAGMRQEVAYLPQPELLGDMYELLDTLVCWIGAMNEEDARQMLLRGFQTAPPPTEAEIEAILSLTGGFPVLLRAMSQWWLNQPVPPPLAEWPALLEAQQSFDYRLARLWDNLTQEEQFALVAVCDWQERLVKAREKAEGGLNLAALPPPLAQALHYLSQNHAPTLARLAAKGMCLETDLGWEINGTLLAAYIKRTGPAGRGRIRLVEPGDNIYQGMTPVSKLTPQEDRLLRFLLKHPYHRHTVNHLLDQIWGADDVRTPNDLHRLVSDLRKKIEVSPADPRYLINWRGQGYQFYPEGRPGGE